MKKILTLASVLLAMSAANAANPYLPLWEFIPDGEPYVFEDPDQPGQYRVYVYGSHDNLIQYYCGRDQVVWSAPVDNLRDWRYDGTIFENRRNALGEYLFPDSVGDVLYAPDVTLVTAADGTKTYYLYPNVQHDLRGGLIAKSNRPDGPFEVCNWDPKNPLQTTGILRFDPGVFVDDDGRVYGYWGFERSYAAELDPETMCTVKPGTKIVEDMVSGRYQEGIYHFFEASSIRKIKDKYVFIYSRFAPDGEWGLPETNYTLAYAWSNNPLGPWTYGGTIIDGRGKEQQADGSYRITATPSGNTHGSICEINGKWWVFYHRQAGTNEYSRQAMVAPIEVDVKEGADGYVRISEGEFTSEGFETEGLNPLERHAAGIACYFTGPEPAHQEYPNVIYPGSHTEILRIDYDGETPAYDPSIDRCYMVNNVDGSVVGYKYFNFSQTYGMEHLSLALTYVPGGIDGTMEIWAGRPSAEEGGMKVGEMRLSSELGQTERTDYILTEPLSQFDGKHALFFVFRSDVKGQSLATLCEFRFIKPVTKSPSMHFTIVGVCLVLIVMTLLARKRKK
ncbi:MAG: family 43 glycosylhydrolase [Bacteroidales bacterium]|nr:family 43 glycosylhydrolase [Candidatus Liminaster caballi]